MKNVEIVFLAVRVEKLRLDLLLGRTTDMSLLVTSYNTIKDNFKVFFNVLPISMYFTWTKNSKKLLHSDGRPNKSAWQVASDSQKISQARGRCYKEIYS